jgi:flagellar biogenesis protein FliO
LAFEPTRPRQASPPNYKFRISVEREETPGERGVRLFRDVALLCVALGFVLFMVFLCYRTLFSSTASPEKKKWAMSLLSAAQAAI